MEGPKGWREFCRMAGTATLKFETDKHELLEDAIRNARSIGGDSDTIAAVTGGMAEAYYGIPYALREQALASLLANLFMHYVCVW